jgi:hypothetical protein
LINTFDFFWYDKGEPGARFQGEEVPIGWFLENELSLGPEACDTILDEVNRIESGAIPCVEIPGNENALWIGPLSAQIRNHYFNPPKAITLPLGEFKRIVEQWRTFLTTSPD